MGKVNCANVPDKVYIQKIYDPAHSKTYNKTCVTSKYSDQLLHLPSMARVFTHYENTPIQIYRKFHHQKPKFFR